MNHATAFIRLLAFVTSELWSRNNNNHLQVCMKPLVSLITRSKKGMRKPHTRVTSGRVGYTALSLPLPFFGLGR